MFLFRIIKSIPRPHRLTPGGYLATATSDRPTPTIYPDRLTQTCYLRLAPEDPLPLDLPGVWAGRAEGEGLLDGAGLEYW